jgi:hypothetical protein
MKKIYNRGGQCLQRGTTWGVVFTERYGLIAYIKQIYNSGGVFTARYGLIPYIKQIYNRGGVFTARYGLILYIKQIYNRGGKCLQRGTY